MANRALKDNEYSYFQGLGDVNTVSFAIGSIASGATWSGSIVSGTLANGSAQVLPNRMFLHEISVTGSPCTSFDFEVYDTGSFTYSRQAVYDSGNNTKMNIAFQSPLPYEDFDGGNKWHLKIKSNDATSAAGVFTGWLKYGEISKV